MKPPSGQSRRIFSSAWIGVARPLLSKRKAQARGDGLLDEASGSQAAARGALKSGAVAADRVEAYLDALHAEDLALALACKPDLLIADEPTTGLDVTTEAAVMSLIAELARLQRRATLLVTHNLPLAATHCHRIAVMHAGQIVETAPVARLIAGAQHPYSAELLAAMLSTPLRASVLCAKLIIQPPYGAMSQCDVQLV